jgi:hypothetical protein
VFQLALLWLEDVKSFMLAQAVLHLLLLLWLLRHRGRG